MHECVLLQSIFALTYFDYERGSKFCTKRTKTVVGVTYDMKKTLYAGIDLFDNKIEFFVITTTCDAWQKDNFICMR